MIKLILKSSSKFAYQNSLLIKNWFKIIFLSILFSNIFTSLYKSSLAVSLTQLNNSEDIPPESNLSSVKQSQKNNNGEEILNEIMNCVEKRMNGYTQADIDGLSKNWTQCTNQVLTIAKDGSIRQDASDRTIKYLQAANFQIPQPTSRGQAKVQLNFLPNSKIFTIPVKVGTETKIFLLDTGASTSVIDTQTAKKLSLYTTPIPGDIYKQRVICDDCSQVQANIHQLPSLTVHSTTNLIPNSTTNPVTNSVTDSESNLILNPAVTAATVTGLHGLGLPQQSMIGNTSGILGLDFLSRFDMVVNPKKRTLHLLPPSQSITGGIPLQGRLGVMTAKVKINGKGPFTFLVDTGAESVILSKSLAQQLSLNDVKGKEIDMMGLGGLAKGKEIKLSSVTVEEHNALEIDAVILDTHYFFNYLGVQGILGQSFLSKYHQHWHFGKRNSTGYIQSGSLILKNSGD